MLILVCGSRSWDDKRAIRERLAELHEEHGSHLMVIHGNAKGADRIAMNQCVWLGIRSQAFPADWRRHGKAAGPIRNRQMLDESPSLVLAFSNGSHGTQDTIDEARRRRIPVEVYGREAKR